MIASAGPDKVAAMGRHDRPHLYRTALDHLSGRDVELIFMERDQPEAMRTVQHRLVGKLAAVEFGQVGDTGASTLGGGQLF